MNGIPVGLAPQERLVPSGDPQDLKAGALAFKLPRDKPSPIAPDEPAFSPVGPILALLHFVWFGIFVGPALVAAGFDTSISFGLLSVAAVLAPVALMKGLFRGSFAALAASIAILGVDAWLLLAYGAEAAVEFEPVLGKLVVVDRGFGVTGLLVAILTVDVAIVLLASAFSELQRRYTRVASGVHQRAETPATLLLRAPAFLMLLLGTLNFAMGHLLVLSSGMPANTFGFDDFVLRWGLFNIVWGIAAWYVAVSFRDSGTWAQLAALVLLASYVVTAGGPAVDILESFLRYAIPVDSGADYVVGGLLLASLAAIAALSYHLLYRLQHAATVEVPRLTFRHG